jgi:hypothetical protein
MNQIYIFCFMSDDSEINDIREPGAFKSVTFSKYKKTEARNQMLENIDKGKIEPACYWCAELVCAGHYTEVWETILYYIGKHIHLGNPKIVIYIQNRFEIFKNIVSQGHFLNELQLRNNPTIRKLFAELICTVTLSNKKNSFESIKINRIEEFDMTQMTERLKAPNTNYIEPILMKEDPKELFIPINEFLYHISPDSKNMLNACYWIEWMVEFDNICKKRKEPVYCQRRGFVNVEKKYTRDIIWILWDGLLVRSEEVKNPFLNKLMQGLLDIFSIRYTTASCKKRRYLLYFAVALLTEPVPTNIELVTKKDVIENVVGKINQIYKQIKKNEESPNTEYLFANVEKQNTFERSMKQMELVNSIQFT